MAKPQHIARLQGGESFSAPLYMIFPMSRPFFVSSSRRAG